MAPRQQVVWLDFEGGNRVQIGWEPVLVMNQFSAEAISSRYAGQTDYIVNLLILHIQQDLASNNVVVLDSKHHVQPAEPCSKIYFGNYNANYLGLADGVDTGNEMLADEAIVYSEDLAMYESLQPTPEEVAEREESLTGRFLSRFFVTTQESGARRVGI